MAVCCRTLIYVNAKIPFFFIFSINYPVDKHLTRHVIYIKLFCDPFSYLEKLVYLQKGFFASPIGFGTFEIGIEFSEANDNMYASISSLINNGNNPLFFDSIKDLHVEVLWILGAAPYGREQWTSRGSHLSDFSTWTVGSGQELGMIVLVTAFLLEFC